MIFNIIILALFALVASTTLLSAYGSICTVYNLPRASPPYPPGSTFGSAYVLAFQPLYITFNIMRWILAGAWGVLLYLYFTKWPWKRIFIIGMIISVLGFVAGLVPLIISGTEGFTVPFDIENPNLSVTFANFMAIIVFLLLNFVPRLKRATINYVEARSVAGQYVKQLLLMSLFFFWLGGITLLGSEFMRAAHIVDGVNVWQTIEIQFIGGVITTAIGASMLSTALIYHKIRPTSAPIRTK
ncbi:MAG: hypothetical protein ACFFDN_18995 [Candidatus Hodarchaeota archaeon]